MAPAQRWDADEAVTQLYAAHYTGLVRLAALLVRNSGEAEEIVQDAFVAMHGAGAGCVSPTRRWATCAAAWSTRPARAPAASQRGRQAPAAQAPRRSRTEQRRAPRRSTLRREPPYMDGSRTTSPSDSARSWCCATTATSPSVTSPAPSTSALGAVKSHASRGITTLRTRPRGTAMSTDDPTRPHGPSSRGHARTTRRRASSPARASLQEIQRRTVSGRTLAAPLGMGRRECRLSCHRGGHHCRRADRRQRRRLRAQPARPSSTSRAKAIRPRSTRSGSTAPSRQPRGTRVRATRRYSRRCTSRPAHPGDPAAGSLAEQAVRAFLTSATNRPRLRDGMAERASTSRSITTDGDLATIALTGDADLEARGDLTTGRRNRQLQALLRTAGADRGGVVHLQRRTARRLLGLSAHLVRGTSLW